MFIKKGVNKMANKKTEPVTEEQMKTIIQTIRSGFLNTHPNDTVAAVLVVEGNLGLRISDILKLKLEDIKLISSPSGGIRYHLDITEKKTGKQRTFIVNKDVYLFLLAYCRKHNRTDKEKIFQVSERWCQKILQKACDYLGYDGSVIGTHSFRKFFATELYYENEKDIRLIQTVLQHSSSSVTARYIGVSSQQVENALENHKHIF